jgi:MFS family permease
MCTTELQFIVAAIFYGFGFGAIFPALQAWCSQLVGLHDQESAMASFSYQVIYIIAACSYVVLVLILLVKYKSVGKLAE